MSQKKLSDVRGRIARTSNEINALQAIKRNRASVAATLDASVAGWLEKAKQIGRINAARSSAGEQTAFLTVNARVGGVAVAIDLGPIAVLLLGADAVNSALSAHLVGVPEGMPAGAKAKKIEQLTSALAAAQYEEEGIIRALEADGEIVTYRGDANPHYALTWAGDKS